MYIDRLIDEIKKKNNPSVIGLDPKIEYVPGYIKDSFFNEFGATFEGAAQAIIEFNTRLIDAICDIVPAVKPQLAYYEMYGIEGIKAFDETVKYAKKKGLLVIADGKRNDIGSTAQAYSAAYLGNTPIEKEKHKAFDADALTVNPYLGIDGIKPFIDDCANNDKGIFVLVKTSNPSSGQLQDLKTESGKAIYETVAEYVAEWGETVKGKYGYSSVGAVVGATYPEQAKVLREIMKNAYILVPGYGAQGGTAKDAAASFNKDGLGAIVNASRSVMCAYKSDKWNTKYDENSFAEAARAEAIRMRDEIVSAIEN